MKKRKVLSLSKKMMPTGVNQPEPKQSQNVIEHNKKKERIKKAYQALKELNLKAPIAIGSGPQIKSTLKEQGHEATAIRIAIQRWIRSADYLDAVILEKYRFNLDGSPAQEITKEEKDFSKDLLDNRKS